jgi:hypothetical protein
MHDQAILSRPVFVAGGWTVRIGDVIEASRFRGDLDSAFRALEHLAACEREAMERGFEPDLAALQQHSEQWRYDRNLISAEETERWLQERGLSEDDFAAYFLRRQWQAAVGGHLRARDEATSPAVEPDARALAAEVLLSGEFDVMALELAQRVAAGGAARDWNVLEREHARECREALAHDAIVKALELLRPSLVRLTLEVIEVESRDAANEAAHCLREGSASLADIAREGRYPHRTQETLAAHLPDGLRARCVLANPGDVLGPFARGDGFELCLLLRKAEPDLTDATVREAAEQHVLEEHFARLVAARVRWILAIRGA